MADDEYFDDNYSGADDESFVEDAPIDDIVEETDEIDENEEENDMGILHKVKETKNDLVSVDKAYELYYTNSKSTKPFLTKFERAKILGVRAEMIASGAPSTISVPKGVTSAYEIAKLELEKKRIPLMIKRQLTDGSVELWRLEDLVY